MTPPLRAYQRTAVDAVADHWRAGVRRVCLVAPTGAGKTRMGVELPRVVPVTTPRVLWLAHRRELITQAAARLRDAGYDVGCISPTHSPDLFSPYQVASLDTLVARAGFRPPADLVIHDECHHSLAPTWRAVLDSYADALHVGLTATPQRRDGRPLGDMYDSMVIAAQYSELIAEGSLVPCRIFRPPEYLGADLAQEPLDAWQRYAQGGQTFAFAAGVQQAHDYAESFRAAGIASAALDGTTPAAERADILARFRAGEVTVLWNVYVLTEGVDVPAARVCLLARGCSHAGPYLQMVGRVLRPHPGKRDALLIDLSGASWLHGYPTQDRHYALDGRAIAAIGESLKNCPQCGACVPSATRVCAETLTERDGTDRVCGYEWPRQIRPLPRIWDLELAEAIAAAGGDADAVGDDHRRREWERLRVLCADREWGVSWAAKQWAGIFGSQPPREWLAACTDAEKRREYQSLSRLQRGRGFKRGFVGVRYRELFGTWPPRAWDRADARTEDADG